MFEKENIERVLRDASDGQLIRELQRRMKVLRQSIPDNKKRTLYTVPQLAEACNVKISTVQRWIREQDIEASKHGRSYLVEEEEYNRVVALRGFERG